MDYARVYADFIKDRRALSLAPGRYAERHHIVPRCVGGTDDPDNLIRLTPEDHYFAHLLLAKAYGGPHWASVYAMCHLVNGVQRCARSKLKARIQFGHVRRSLATYYRGILSGPSGKIADRRQHDLVHFDGRVARGDRFSLSDQTGVTRQQISAVLRGAKKSAHGWFSPAHNPDGLRRSELISLGVRDKTIVNLFHHDGRTWSGTKVQFRKKFGASLTFQHPEGCVMGWYRTKEQAIGHGELRSAVLAKALHARGNISGHANPNADDTLYPFRVLATGQIVVTTKVKAKELFGVSSASLCALFNGKQKKTHGIALAETKNTL